MATPPIEVPLDITMPSEVKAYVRGVLAGYQAGQQTALAEVLKMYRAPVVSGNPLQACLQDLVKQQLGAYPYDAQPQTPNLTETPN